MEDINWAAVAAAVLAAFVVSSVWYAVFTQPQAAGGKPAAPADERPEPRKMAMELVRSALLATVIAWLVTRTDMDGWQDVAGLGVALWVGFPLVLLSGSVLWENVPVKTAALHAGDWLIKLLAVTAIVGLWP